MHFYQPQARKLYNIIKRSNISHVDPGTLAVLENTSAACKTCRIFSTKPLRFKVSDPTLKIIFNETVALDLMWLNHKAVLHVVDIHAHFSNAVFLKGHSVEDVWQAFVECWSSVYMSFPNRLKLDQGSAFTSARWKKLADTVGMCLELSGIESHNSLGSGERYHDPLRRIFRKITYDNESLTDEAALRLSVSAMNHTMGPEGLTPSLLVFGAQPRFPAPNTALPNQRERMKALRNARAEMEAITAELRVRQALLSRAPQAASFVIKPKDKVWCIESLTSGM